jgi:hypothetical protein
LIKFEVQIPTGHVALFVTRVAPAMPQFAADWTRLLVGRVADCPIECLRALTKFVDVGWEVPGELADVAVELMQRNEAIVDCAKFLTTVCDSEAFSNEILGAIEAAVMRVVEEDDQALGIGGMLAELDQVLGNVDAGLVAPMLERIGAAASCS